MGDPRRSPSDVLASAGLTFAESADPWGRKAFVVEGGADHHRALLESLGAWWDESGNAWVLEEEDGSAPDAKGGRDASTHAGHRDRLRERFLSAGSKALADHELLELLLFYSVPRKDTKPIAKALLKRFGTLAGVLAADPRDLLDMPDVRRNSAAHLKAIHAVIERVLKAEVTERPVVSSWQALLDYCEVAMGHAKTEQFRLLFLDTKNKLIADEVQQTGTVNHTPVYPREVVKRALELGASALILVHNHPSGDPTPSRADIDMTRQIVDAGRPLGLVVHDHLVIGRGRHYSFKSEGLL
ncbi:MAG: hypothetical protein CMM50_08985 [Rhodospirillaceae bacterium]|nr:hypothetical protein [Rhodospirillaceae bacterium]